MIIIMSNSTSHHTRCTAQRRTILEELQGLTTHPTADELHVLVRRKLPRVSLATVYRNLEVLAGQGLVQRLDLTGHQKRFDGRTEHHLHIRCVNCDRVSDLEGEYNLPPCQAVAGQTDFEVTGVRVEFLGVCPECQMTKSSEGEAEC